MNYYIEQHRKSKKKAKATPTKNHKSRDDDDNNDDKYEYKSRDSKESNEPRRFQAVSNSFMNGIRGEIDAIRTNESRHQRRNRVNTIVGQLNNDQSGNGDINNFQNHYHQLQQEHQQLQYERFLLSQQLQYMDYYRRYYHDSNYYWNNDINHFPTTNVQTQPIQQMPISSNNGHCDVLTHDSSIGSTISNTSISTINDQFDDINTMNVLQQQSFHTQCPQNGDTYSTYGYI